MEDVGLGAQGYWNGSDGTGGFRSQAVVFSNAYDTLYGSWMGFACSSVNNTNSGQYTNQYAAISGTGVGGAGQYAVAYYGMDYDTYTFVPPTVTLPVACRVSGFYINNTTYAVRDMQNGSMFSKRFGGSSGDDPDWLTVTVVGLDASGNVTGSNTVYLADFRFSDHAQDYILQDWTWVDLTALGPNVKTLQFSMDSSDTAWGFINTPTYFALDSLTTLESYAPEAGAPGSTAIAAASNAIVAWATGWTNYVVGANCDARWQHPDYATGPADAIQHSNTNGIACLGDAGRITLTFNTPIKDGPGNDFAVFENATGGFGAFFLEFAYIEVSSDGTHFYRMFNRSLVPGPVGSYDTTLAPDVTGLGCKYEGGYGEPYDLAQLAGQTNIDLQAVRFVRVLDIVGDGSCTDSVGHAIYDPCPVYGSAGFDLDAIAVLSNAVDEVSVAATIPQGAEAGPCRAEFTLTRKAWTTGAACTVHVALAGTASNGVDYARVPSTVTIPAGRLSTTVTILPLADAVAEGSETVTLEVLPDAAYLVGAASQATVTLVDQLAAGLDAWRRRSLQVDMEDVGLGAQGYWNGSDGTGGFRSQAVVFSNAYDTLYGSWMGFACSSVNNTNSGQYTNQYAAISGTGVGGAGQYAVAYYGMDYDTYTFVPPTVTLPVACRVSGFYINNTTYAVRDMQNGSMFSKRFGGSSGDDPDWLTVTVVGLDASGNVTGSNTVYLADFRFSDHAQDYILQDWTWVDLTALGPNVKTLQFSMDSSDTAWGFINTPTYFALDNLEIDPASAAAGDAADWNGDGTANLMAYAAGYGMGQSLPTPAWACRSTNDAGNIWFEVEFQRRHGLADATLVPQYTTNLVDGAWVGGPGHVQESITATAGGVDTVRARMLDSASDGTGFVRLQAARP